MGKINKNFLKTNFKQWLELKWIWLETSFLKFSIKVLPKTKVSLLDFNLLLELSQLPTWSRLLLDQKVWIKFYNHLEINNLEIKSQSQMMVLPFCNPFLLIILQLKF